MNRYLLLMGILLAVGACSTDSYKADKKAITESMLLSQEYWNSGDLDNFMHNYWQSDSMMFIGKTGITYGYEPSLARYKRGYPDKSAMGRLEYAFKELRPIGKKHYHQVGQYTLYREKDTLSGHFTLIWEKMNGEWKIISDHSS